MCNKHVFNMNNSVNSVHRTITTANLCSLKKKIGEPAGTNISTIIANSLVRLGLVKLG